MAPPSQKKRKAVDTTKPHAARPKKFRKQTHYSSSSSSSASEVDVDPIDPADSTSKPSPKASQSKKPHNSIHRTGADPTKSAFPSPSPTSASSAFTDNDSDSASQPESQPQDPTRPARSVPKRKDPLAFSASLATILGTKLPASARADPVLARSQSAKEASHALAEGKLETKARRALREEKRKLGEKGRVRDVVLGDRGVGGPVGPEGEVSAAGNLELERRLRKTAQRGVVKLFNAVRAAQVKGEEAGREARAKGVVGEKRREERVGEMGKKAFLELVAGGG
ncbi:hypothetical protein MMC13_004466 [Lambiella insularis]|nr:hypothetical protein [Lambiella insularis]